MPADDSNAPPSTHIEAASGTAADAAPTPFTIRLAPTQTNKFNTLRPALIPLACWKAEDILFKFDASFIRPMMAAQVADLRRLMNGHAGCRISLFGHADPSGPDAYNKALSGRRVRAVYGMLTRNVGMWVAIAKDEPAQWGDDVVDEMLSTIGISDDDHASGVSAYQQQKGMSASGTADDATRRALYADYMDAICQDENGKPFTLTAGTDFLAGGADGGGKGDYQGCGEFNPVLIFSADEQAAYDAAASATPPDTVARDKDNAPNRRVLGFLFRKGTVVDPARWPCPRSTEPMDGCTARFWSDFKVRRQPSRERRTFDSTADTFACRFYDRLSSTSPCDGKRRVFVDLESVDELAYAVPKAKLTLVFGDGTRHDIVTDSTGYYHQRNVPEGDMRVLLPDGSLAKYMFGNGNELKDAILDPALITGSITRIVVKYLSEATRKAHKQINDNYVRDRGRPDDQVNGRQGTPAPPQPTDNGGGGGGGTDDDDGNDNSGGDTDPSTSTTVRTTRGTLVCVDNLTLAAANLTGFDNLFSDGLPRFFNLLRQWLGDHHPAAAGRGYYVHLLDEKQIRTYPSGGTLLNTSKITVTPAMPIGAYAVFQDVHATRFVDMTYLSVAASLKGDATDQSQEVPIADAIDPADLDGFNQAQAANNGRVEILYRFPSPGFLAFAGTVGGSGVLEDYPLADPAMNGRVHDRNLAVVRFVSLVYSNVIDKYINDVKNTTEEDDIRKMGPPPSPFVYASPVNATDRQVTDLFNASRGSSLRAWAAIAEQVDHFANRHAEGAMFFRVKLRFRPSRLLDSPNTDGGENQMLGWFKSQLDEIAFEDNLDVGSDGVMTKGPTATGQLSTPNGIVDVGGTNLPVARVGGRVGGKAEYNIQTGKTKETFVLDTPYVRAEASDDGTRKLTLPNGASSEINPTTGEFGTGARLPLGKGRLRQAVDVYIGIHFQGIREDTALAFVAGVPGFFERRSTKDLFSSLTQWNDLRSDEQMRLRTLGWTAITWDTKRTSPASAAPATTRTKWEDLTPAQQIALIGLGIRQADQPGIWKKNLGTNSASIGPDPDAQPLN